jgi:hypothetical protein
MVSILVFASLTLLGRSSNLGFNWNIPNNVRANGQSFGTGIHWIFAALITLMGPVVMIYSKKILVSLFLPL